MKTNKTTYEINKSAENKLRYEKSLLNSELLHGTYSATITNYEEIPAKLDDDMTVIRDAYILVTLRLNNEIEFKTRWYAKRLNYIMYSINAQFSEYTYKLSELLEKCRKTPFNVTIDIDPRYGYQVEYSA